MFSGSKKTVLDIIKRQGSLTLDEITNRTDLSKTTLREHLLQMERDGYIRRAYVRSGPGRPSLSYKLTSMGHRLFPSSESELLRGLLNYLKSEENESIIEQYFKIYWDKRLQNAFEALKDLPHGGIKEKVTLLCDILEEEGFMPEFEIRHGGKNGEKTESNTETPSDKTDPPSGDTETRVVIKECNCPFSQTLSETRLPCKLEALFFERFLDLKVDRTSYIADGEHSCTYEFIINDLQ